MRPHLFKRTLTLEIDLPSYLVQKKKQTPEKRKRLPELLLQCFHSDPIFPPNRRPGLRSLIKMLFIGLFSLGGEHWFLMLGLSQCQQSKPLLLGQQNIRSVLELEEVPMCPHTHPHRPLTDPATGWQVTKNNATWACLYTTQSGWGFLFLMLFFVIIQNYK